MARRKKVLAVRTKYSEIKVHKDMLTYITSKITTGSTSILFKDPHITTLFYGLGTTAKIALLDAIDVYIDSPIEANRLIVEAKMALAIIWLDSYTDQVENIANDPFNCTTRGEAAANIELAGLTAQKISLTKKTKPQTPTFTAKIIG